MRITDPHRYRRCGSENRSGNAVARNNMAESNANRERIEVHNDLMLAIEFLNKTTIFYLLHKSIVEELFGIRRSRLGMISDR
jgi:hypothetical protein